MTMITADMHTHSYFSGDSEEPTREMVKSAVEKGLKTLCLTEHHDFDYPDNGFELNVEEYKTELFRLKDEFSDKIELLFGVELGIMGYLSDRLNEFVKDRGFDFIIASTHLVDGKDPYYPEYFENLGTKNGILRYFESTLENISSYFDFDVYGHLDYVVRYSAEKSYDPIDYREIIDEILKKLISMGKGIEINTAGLKALGYVHPHRFVLERYRELGGEVITVGSDAHDRTRVAAGFDEAEQALKNAGFEYYAVFRARKAKFIKL